jgi:hypothetical protein
MSFGFDEETKEAAVTAQKSSINLLADAKEGLFNQSKESKTI